MDKSKFKYKCSKCEKKFRFQCRLKEHEELLHSGKTYFCSKCSKEFKRKATRDLHEKSHEVDFSWEECDLCEAKFLTRDALGYHIQRVHNEGLEATHHCVFCERGFLCLRDFHRHIRYHIKEKPYFCKCGNEFRDQYALASHKETHKPREERPRPFKCNRCPKTYLQPEGLSSHIKIFHLNLKSFQCKACGKKLGTPKGLKEHTKTHTGERPYPCTVCSKRFAGSGDLKKHLRTHTGERPYPCRYCDKAFGRSFVRRNHERSIHGKF